MRCAGDTKSFGVRAYPAMSYERRRDKKQKNHVCDNTSETECGHTEIGYVKVAKITIFRIVSSRSLAAKVRLFYNQF